jgi:AraC-like DNA-binding protein
MSQLLRAEDAPVRSRADYWHHVIEQTLGGLDVRVPSGSGFRDTLLIGSAGAIRVAELSSPAPGRASRTPRHIRRSDLDICKIDVLSSGRGVVEQDGRQAPLRPGDFTFVDLSRPARWSMSSMRVVAVVFPRSLLPLSPDEVRRLTATRFPGDQGTAALVSSLARELVRHLDDWAAADGVRLGTAVVDLLTVALAARLDRAERMPPDTRQRALLRRVQAFIEARLDDPDLSPGMVATAHHISPRYLYKLFETEQASVAGWIRCRRLERCRRDLLDPALADRSVSAIAARWGLVNAAHFSRAFRAAYGAAPVEYRARRNGAGSSPRGDGPAAGLGLGDGDALGR